MVKGENSLQVNDDTEFSRKNQMKNGHYISPLRQFTVKCQPAPEETMFLLHLSSRTVLVLIFTWFWWYVKSKGCKTVSQEWEYPAKDLWYTYVFFKIIWNPFLLHLSGVCSLQTSLGKEEVIQSLLLIQLRDHMNKKEICIFTTLLIPN